MKQLRALVRNTPVGRVVQTHLHKRVMTQFADKMGFVYFGYVNQRDDEHRLVRGLTASTQHRDNHYCIGSFDGYDITVVERTDTITHPTKKSGVHRWNIIAIDLHTNAELPHMFVGLHTHTDAFYARLFTMFSSLSRVPTDYLGLNQAAFVHKYVLYAEPVDFVHVQNLFSPVIAATFTEHFGRLTVEVADNVLYIYAEDHIPSIALLDKMLRNGLWLAKLIDQSPRH